MKREMQEAHETPVDQQYGGYDGQGGIDFPQRRCRLYAAASCRERADWLVGLNCTWLFSVLYNAVLNTGRVQSPTPGKNQNRQSDYFMKDQPRILSKNQSRKQSSHELTEA